MPIIPNLPIAEELRRRGIRPNRRLGQNFMVDRQMLDFLARTAGLVASDIVLEVGTGAGFLTERLCQDAGWVISVEIDAGLYELARERLEPFGNLTLIHGDALAGGDDWSEAVSEAISHASSQRPAPSRTGGGAVSDASKVSQNAPHKASPARSQDAPKGGTPSTGRSVDGAKIVANLPYCVATAVVQAALGSVPPFSGVWVTCQHEVAQRLTATPGQEEYGFISVLVALFAQVRIVRKLPPTVFWPRPKVESAIVEILPILDGKWQPSEMQTFRRVISQLFTQRRRQLSAVLRGLDLDAGVILQVRETLDKAGIPLEERVFRLSAPVLLEVSRAFPPGFGSQKD